MLHVKVLLAAAIVAAGCQSGLAYVVKGGVECPGILEEDQNEVYREMNKWWLLGYITARNYENDLDKGLNIEDDELYRMGLEFCQQNPDNDWDDAAISIYDQLP